MGVVDQCTTAIRMWREADQGHTGAMYQFGSHYAAGLGVKQGYVEATHRHRMAAKLGHSGAQLLLGAALSSAALRYQRTAPVELSLHLRLCSYKKPAAVAGRWRRRTGGSMLRFHSSFPIAVCNAEHALRFGLTLIDRPAEPAHAST